MPHAFFSCSDVMSADGLRQLLQGLPELAAWPEIADIFQRAPAGSHPDWSLPVLACQAVGGGEAAGRVGMAAVACSQMSIILVDDMLDDDPRGEHLRRGYGPTANLALALQAAAGRFLEQAAVNPGQIAAAANCLAHLNLATAAGQHLDVQNLDGEEGYWRVVQAKSTPFYGGALQLGALLGGASPAIAAGLYQLGVLIGFIIQLGDDLTDAFQTPANPDWTQGRNNLLILYGRTADYPERPRFLQLLEDIHNTAALEEAQQLLITNGAVSFCAYHLIDHYQKALGVLQELPLVNPQPLRDILARYGESLAEFLQVGGGKVSIERLRTPLLLE